MKFIAHRGNLKGPDPLNENRPEHIEEALKQGFDAEIDLWVVNDDDDDSQNLYLGHDEPQYAIEHAFLLQQGLWIHCKNVEALEYCKTQGIEEVNDYFWHQEDDVVLTAKGYFWTFPGKPLTSYSIAVMPETKAFTNMEQSYAICTDYPQHHRDKSTSTSMSTSKCPLFFSLYHLLRSRFTHKL